jgi:hypothetical protein
MEITDRDAPSDVDAAPAREAVAGWLARFRAAAVAGDPTGSLTCSVPTPAGGTCSP